MFQQPAFNLPTNLSHDFSKAPRAQISRSQIDRSSGYKSAFDAGYLIPFFWDEVLPGDTFNVKATILARLATPKFPVMDNLFIDTQWFFCPERLLWKSTSPTSGSWERFCGERDDPLDTIDFIMPVQTAPAAGYAENSLGDYFGIPIDIAGTPNPRAGIFRMYNRTYNEWYRDENLQNSLVVDLDDGPDLDTDYVPVRRGKRHDYFTSCLPWPQKGDAVTLPLTGDADILLDTTLGEFQLVRNAATHALQAGAATMGWTVTTSRLDNTGGTTVVIDPNGTLVADLSSVTGATVNDLIQSFAIQDLLVRDARGGTRYTEILQTHFGVTSPDSRLQRVEYLGGSSKPLSFYAVPNTSDTATYKQGALAAYAQGIINNEGFVKSFTEHGLLLGLVSMRADLNYQQGLDRKWSRSTRYDFYWPSLANLGEQAVLNKEIYLQGTAGAGADDLVFGYQERWAEYRYKPSLVTGAMRSAAATPLDSWHLAQDFSALPTLGTGTSVFIQENPPVDRVIQVTSEPHLIFDAFIKAICARPMPLYSVPSLATRF